MTTRCYGIDGTPYATFDRYIPCNSTAASTGGFTACCAPGDNCLSNGLCQSQADNSRKANLFWRNGCTDPSWNSPACPKYCNSLDAPDTHGIYYCLQKDSYCCPTGPINTGPTINTTCCSLSNLAFSAADPVVYTTAAINFISTVSPAQTTAISKPSSNSPAGSLTSAPSQASETSPGSSSTTSSSSNDKMGIYVGVPLGVLLAIALAVVAWLAVRNRKLKRENTRHELPLNSASASHAQEQLEKPQEHEDYPQEQQGHAQEHQGYPQECQGYSQEHQGYVQAYTSEEPIVRPNELPVHPAAQELPGRAWR